MAPEEAYSGFSPAKTTVNILDDEDGKVTNFVSSSYHNLHFTLFD